MRAHACRRRGAQVDGPQAAHRLRRFVPWRRCPELCARSTKSPPTRAVQRMLGRSSRSGARGPRPASGARGARAAGERDRHRRRAARRLDQPGGDPRPADRPPDPLCGHRVGHRQRERPGAVSGPPRLVARHGRPDWPSAGVSAGPAGRRRRSGSRPRFATDPRIAAPAERIRPVQLLSRRRLVGLGQLAKLLERPAQDARDLHLRHADISAI